MNDVFWTVYTKTHAGVELQYFTFAKTPVEAQEKIKKHIAEKHAKLREQYKDNQEVLDYVGTDPLETVTGAIWKDTFVA